MSEKPVFTSGKHRPPLRRPLPEPATDGFPAEKDVSIPPLGSDQTMEERDREKAMSAHRPKEPD